MSYVYGGYPDSPAPGFLSASGKVFVGGFNYVVTASSTEEKALFFRNASGSGVQAKLIGFKGTITNLPAAATATAAIVRFYSVESLTGGSGTSATGKNLLMGGAASVCTYHTSATTTATATTLLGLSGATSVINGHVYFSELEKNPIVVPAGKSIFVSVTGGAGLATAIDLTPIWIEEEV